MAGIRLEPCPFCGRMAELISIELGHGREVHMVRCCDGFCTGRLTRRYNDWETAVYAWNKRAPTRDVKGGKTP